MKQKTWFVGILIALLILPGATPAASAGVRVAATSSTRGIENWDAAYWNNTDLSGQPVMVRSESILDHDWGTGSPGAPVNADRFSARWQRSVELPAGTYRFSATSDDGMRVWVDGVRIVDEWHDRPAGTTTVDRTLAGGYHLLAVEYYENLGNALARLTWTPVGAVQHWRGEYYPNQHLSGAPALVRDDAEIRFGWGTGAPAPGLPADRFSVRWTRTLDLQPGRYRFTVTADDGLRLWVNDRLLLDAWRDQPATTYRGDIDVAGSGVPIKLEYYENLGDAEIGLSWAPVGTVQHWRGEYYPNMYLSGVPALVRDDAEIQFAWGTGAPAPGLPLNRFSVRWTRTLNLQPGRYRFTVTADDGVRLWVNSRLLIDAWRDQSATTYSGDIEVPGGGVPVKLEYYENSVDAEIRLSWAPAGAGQHWRGEYFANRHLSGTPALVRNDAQIQFRWGPGSPGPGLPSDNFSVRWTRTLNLEPGRYRFTVTADDGARLWVNNRLLIDAWRIQAPTTYSARIDLPGGEVPVRLEYFEATGGASIFLSWVKR